MLLFAYPMILGNLLQQCYNIADTLIVGRFLGADALAAVGSAYTLMTFLISVIAGLCMGGGAVFSVCKGRGDEQSLKNNGFVCIYRGFFIRDKYLRVFVYRPYTSRP